MKPTAFTSTGYLLQLIFPTAAARPSQGARGMCEGRMRAGGMRAGGSRDAAPAPTAEVKYPGAGGRAEVFPSFLLRPASGQKFRDLASYGVSFTFPPAFNMQMLPGAGGT